jgi:hypothetical protein
MTAAFMMAAILFAVEAVVSKSLQNRRRFFRSIEPARVRPAHCAAAWIGVAVLIAVMFLVSVDPGG